MALIATHDNGVDRFPVHSTFKESIGSVCMASGNGFWDGLYEAPRRLVSAMASERLYAPEAYPLVRSLQRVPIVHAEALGMAAWFPVCWERKGSALRLCVLRSLIANAEGHQPAGSPVRPDSLPLALRAYPITATSGVGEDGLVLVDHVIPDQPTDAGAPLLLPNGKPSRGLLMRYRAALIAAQAVERTVAITEALVETGVFRPWALVFAIDERTTIAINDLLYLDLDQIDFSQLRALIAAFGSDLTTLLTAHRLSLFRINALIAVARKANRPGEAPPLPKDNPVAAFGVA